MNIGFQVQIGVVAMILRAAPSANMGPYLGTCFPFRCRHIFLTARHCIEGLGSADVVLGTQYGRQLSVQRIDHHPIADVSALVSDPNEAGVLHPFDGLHMFPGTYGIGDEFVAFGFPAGGTFAEPASVPTPRVFRGFVQRLADFASGGSAPYRAFELSIPAPSGLSGGPVFAPSERNRVFGVVTGNVDSYTTPVEDVVEVSPDHTHTTTVRRIISYGMALSLWGVEDWLREVAPLTGEARW